MDFDMNHIPRDEFPLPPMINEVLSLVIVDDTHGRRLAAIFLLQTVHSFHHLQRLCAVVINE